MLKKFILGLLTLQYCLIICFQVLAFENPTFKIFNKTQKNIPNKQIEDAYTLVYQKYSKVLPSSLLEKIDPNKIEIYIVETISQPNISETGLTTALIDAETYEVTSITIEVLPGCRKGLSYITFQYLIEHELAHAFAFMANLDQAKEIGHTIKIENLKLKN